MKPKNDGVRKVAQLIYERGDCEQWGAEDNSLEACVELVQAVKDQGQDDLDSGEADHGTLQDLLQEELGLEPDYIMDLWL